MPVESYGVVDMRLAKRRKQILFLEISQIFIVQNIN